MLPNGLAREMYENYCITQIITVAIITDNREKNGSISSFQTTCTVPVPSKSALGIPKKETETEDVDFKRISHSDILKSRKNLTQL